MIDKIIEILEDNFPDDYHEIAMQEKFIKIATEISEIAYPKKFVLYLFKITNKDSLNDLYKIWLQYIK